MESAVIAFAGKQHVVKVGDKIVVPGNFGEVGTKINSVPMLFSHNQKIEIGTPNLAATATLEVLTVKKSAKINVATYRAKSRYRKVRGHRQEETTFQVTALGSLKVKAAPAKVAPKKTTPRAQTTAAKKPVKK